MPQVKTAYEGSEPFAFVSYAHKDSEIVRPLIRGLQARGFRVWYDGGLEVGTEWPDFIAEHLEKSACMVAFVSRNFGDSHNCRQEINFAIDEGKEPVVIYLEPKNVLKAGMRMRLGSLHAMFYDRYPNADAFLDALAKAAIMKPCMGEGTDRVDGQSQLVPYPTIDFADDVKTAPAESPEDWHAKAEKLYEEKKYEEAVVWYRKAAEHGHAEAQNCLGYAYNNGEGVSRDYDEAVKWYRMAAEQGYAAAQNNMGVSYEYGEGVAQDYHEAVKWYRKAALQSYMLAQYNLGACYLRGYGVEKNPAEAAVWFLKAAEQGDADAQFHLGIAYASGNGVHQDDSSAVKWYREASEQGHALAQYHLGLCYYVGSGIRKDVDEAMKWIRKAADQDNGLACLVLGQYYEEGRHVAKDLKQALYWYRKAKEVGVQTAADKAIARCEKALMERIWWTQ